MTLEEKEEVVKGLKGKLVGLHVPQVYQEFTLKSYRIVEGRILADLLDEGVDPVAKITINAVLLFVRGEDGKIAPIFGDSV